MIRQQRRTAAERREANIKLFVVKFKEKVEAKEVTKEVRLKFLENAQRFLAKFAFVRQVEEKEADEETEISKAETTMDVAGSLFRQIKSFVLF